MATEISSANIITIDCAALSYNYKLLCSALPENVELLAMVKGDGYGHGMVKSAEAFYRAGCRAFGVAELCEGVALREAGVEGEIFIMVGFAPEQAGWFFSSKLTPVVFSKHAIELLSQEAEARGETIGLHLKIDSGMGRLGVMPEEAESFVELINGLPNVRLAGMLSHFPEADNPASSSTRANFAAFLRACESAGNEFAGIRHIANSGAVLNFPETLCNMGRAGISLYGYSPDGVRKSGQVDGNFLRPAMKFATRIAMVKEVPPGTGISYGHTFVTARRTRLAVLPVGYEDGYPRSLSSKGEVLIAGKKAPIVGRVCMNLCMADITDIEDDVRAGDEAVLLGEQRGEEITADDIGALAGTISYEILCMLGNNNQRVFIE